MPDDNIIPTEEILELPKIDKDENLGGISFVSESTPQVTNMGDAAGAVTMNNRTEVPKVIQPGVIPPKEIVPEIKPPIISPEIRPTISSIPLQTPATSPKETLSEIKPPIISPEIRPTISSIPVQMPGLSPKEMGAENKAFVRPEPIRMPVDQRFEPKQKEVAEPATNNLKAIRTYQADVAESVKGQKTSLVRMVISEQARKQKFTDLESPHSKRNMVFIISGFILLLSGTVTAIFVFNKYKLAGTVESQPVIQSFIFAENGKVIQVTGLQTEVLTKTISKEVKDANHKLDTIENISLTENIGGSEAPLVTQRLFYLLDNRMPPSLLRSLDKNFMLGVHTFNGNNPFIILKTNFYENTFAGMLGWEQYMARDLFPVFGIEVDPDSQVFIKPFEDKTLKNRDTRALKDDNGNVLLLYTFKDKQTLIITTSSNTMEEVIKKLNSSGAVNR